MWLCNKTQYLLDFPYSTGLVVQVWPIIWYRVLCWVVLLLRIEILLLCTSRWERLCVSRSERGHKFNKPEKIELDGDKVLANNYVYATVEISAPLVKAKLSFECKSYDYGRKSSYLIYRNDLRELLLKLLHVPKLTISTWCLQVRFLSRLKLRYNAQYLTVS